MKEKKDAASEKKGTNQFALIIGTIIILSLVFFVSYFYFRSINRIEYEGLTFTKELYGKLPLYHYYYYITPQLKYNLYLRKDPRTNMVPVIEVGAKSIEFSQLNTVYISLEPDALIGCEYGIVGIATLSDFLTGNQLHVKGASTDADFARKNNIKYAACDFRPNDDVIVIKNGNETKIVLVNDNCYIIEVANCEVIEAIEKFEVRAILDAKKRKQQQMQ